MPEFNANLFLATNPQTLKDYYEKVQTKPLPSIEERGKMYEYLGIGPASEYLGTAGQNKAILEMLYLLAQQQPE